MRVVTKLLDKEMIERLGVSAKKAIYRFDRDVRLLQYYVPVYKHFSADLIGYVERLELRDGIIYATLSNEHIQEWDRVNFNNFTVSSTNFLNGKLTSIMLWNH